jgi:hypothetical protein
MTDSTIHPAPGAGSTPGLTPTTRTDLQATAKLFAETYSTLLSVASDDPHVNPGDSIGIMDGLEKRLHQCSEPMTERAFIEWAQPQIIRERNLIAIMRQHESAARKGLWRVLRECADLGLVDRNPGTTGPQENLIVETLLSEIWIWCWEHFDELLTPGPAKLSTRINERASYTAKEWKTQQIRSRKKFSDLDEADLLPTDFHAERLSAAATRRDAVDTWLIGFLCQGPQPANDVKTAGKAKGYGRTQLEGAVKRLGVVVRPTGFGQPWTWELPGSLFSSLAG